MSQDTARGRIRTLLSDGKPRTRLEIAHAIDMLPRDASAQISQMVKRGMLFKDDGNGSGYMHRYSDRPMHSNPPAGTRVCAKCAQEFPLIPLHWYAKSKKGGRGRGFMYVCKDCHRAGVAERDKYKVKKDPDEYHLHEGRILMQPTPGGRIVRFGAQWRPQHNSAAGFAWSGYESTLCRCD